MTGNNVSFDWRDGGGWKWIPVSGGAGGSCQQNITTGFNASGGMVSGNISCVPGGNFPIFYRF